MGTLTWGSSWAAKKNAEDIKKCIDTWYEKVLTLAEKYNDAREAPRWIVDPNITPHIEYQRGVMTDKDKMMRWVDKVREYLKTKNPSYRDDQVISHYDHDEWKVSFISKDSRISFLVKEKDLPLFINREFEIIDFEGNAPTHKFIEYRPSYIKHVRQIKNDLESKNDL